MTLTGKGLLVVRSNRMEGRTAMASLSLEHIGKKYPNGYEGVKDFNLDIADKKFIIFDECVKTLTIHTDNTTYQMQVDEIGNLLHLYYGRRTEGNLAYLPSRFDRGTSASPYEKADDRSYSLDFLPQEFPSPLAATSAMRATRFARASTAYRACLPFMRIPMQTTPRPSRSC